MNTIKRDLVCNYISLVIMAITGLLMNTIVAVVYGAAVLGVFSETYAWYTILSQISVWGIHMAVVKYVPEKKEDTEKGTILKNGIIIVTISSVIITILAEIAVFFLGDFAWKGYMKIALTGIVLMSINKVLLNYLNALSKMTAFAFFSAIRYVFFGVFIWIVSAIHIAPDYLPFAFPITELVGFVSLLIYYMFRMSIKGKINRFSLLEMVEFGTKLIPSYMVLEMNTKVDVVCLGLLSQDIAQIGIYSFAIYFTEGFYLLYVTIRRIVNPELSKANIDGVIRNHIESVKEKLKKILVYGGGGAYLGVSVAYIFLCIILNRGEYKIGVIYILIICFAIVLNGKYIVFGDVLAQTGHPWEESIVNIITVVCNFVFNILFILLLGPIGAAIATATSHFVYSACQKVVVKRCIRISL